MQDVSLDALELLTVAELARLMKVSKATAWRKVGSGEIESIKVGRARRVTPAALAAYFEKLRAEQGAA
jgi:excisionase family DNA binding protein